MEPKFAHFMINWELPGSLRILWEIILEDDE